MAEWQGKSRGNKAGHHFFVVLLKNLGLYPAYFFLLFIAGYFYFFATADVKNGCALFSESGLDFQDGKQNGKFIRTIFYLDKY